MPAKTFRCGTCKAEWTIPAEWMESRYGPIAAHWEKHYEHCPDKPREVAY